MRLSILLLLMICKQTMAQFYFPPLSGDVWETTPPADLGYCAERIDSLYALLEAADSKSFILIKDGRIVLEQYFGTYTQDSLWYWASAGKSLAAMLVGIAEGDGILSIEDPTSMYLGNGWTTAPAEKEDLITIRHQITMTTGLADNVLFPDCLDPDCLTYMVDAGERWSYYNAPYRLVQEVLESASGTGINLYTWTRLGSRIGMGGLWVDHIRYGKARDMARFGLLALNEGVWDTDTLITDPQYFADMTSQSQDLNEAYGYLWWLNGTETTMLPGSQIVWQNELVPSAPDDMYAALGKNDQKIYVVPSQGLVVVRQGESAGQAAAGPSSFDEDLWVRINELVCDPNGLVEASEADFKLYPNPATDQMYVSTKRQHDSWVISDARGSIVKQGYGPVHVIDISNLPAGIYSLQMKSEDWISSAPFVKN